MREELAALIMDPQKETRTFKLLEFMREHGQSVIVNWGEDDDLWECSWISSGERFTTHNRHLQDAVELTARKVLDRMRDVR